MEQPNRIINVAGDYVQSKHVDYEINNVEAGGIGIQIVIYLKFFITFAVDLHLKYGIRQMNC